MNQNLLEIMIDENGLKSIRLVTTDQSTEDISDNIQLGKLLIPVRFQLEFDMLENLRQ